MKTVASLHGLLSWAHKQYRLETPELDHSKSDLFDESGSPEMKPAAAAYLGLQAKRLMAEDRQPDNWKRLAARKDRDGRYATPLRYAIELAPDPGERSFLRSLVPEVYFPSEIAELHGIPKWAGAFVMYATLDRLRARYDQLMRDQEKGTAANVGWVSRSEAQRTAESAA